MGSNPSSSPPPPRTGRWVVPESGTCRDSCPAVGTHDRERGFRSLQCAVRHRRRLTDTIVRAQCSLLFQHRRHMQATSAPLARVPTVIGGNGSGNDSVWAASSSAIVPCRQRAYHSPSSQRGDRSSAASGLTGGVGCLASPAIDERWQYSEVTTAHRACTSRSARRNPRLRGRLIEHGR
jgi:hypothetical protein